jgi:dihydroorotase
VKGLPLHTLVRGRFVMKDRTLVESTRGFGRSVHKIQHMPEPELRNTDLTMQAIVRDGGGQGRERVA